MAETKTKTPYFQFTHAELLEQRDELMELVRAIDRATRDDEKNECWTIRKFLEQRGVYDGNLTGSRRLVAEACKRTLVWMEAR